MGVPDGPDLDRDPEQAARLLEKAVQRRVALCLRPDSDGQDVVHRAERAVLDVEVRDLLRLVEFHERGAARHLA